MTDWREEILTKFSETYVPLTVVSDPDGILQELEINSRLRDQGYDILYYHNEAAFTREKYSFRYRYESIYRSGWDVGIQYKLLLALAQRAAIDLTHSMLLNRKREFTVRPYVLFVFDEAQEFVSQPSGLRGIDKACSEEVERLLRQGRKYGLGGCIATQRIAYLNTNALQQLHTYFVSTLPRPYDRGVISNTFMIDKAILEKTLEFVPGEWLVSSYLATGMANVPIFVKADNAEKKMKDI